MKRLQGGDARLHRVESITVEGFWETHNLRFNLFDDVTFFIGQNGTGKTTIINLIAAALTGDFFTLDRISFKKISIYLVREGAGEKCVVNVVKTMTKGRRFETIEYIIKQPGKADARFSLDDDESQFLLRRNDAPRLLLNEMYRRHTTGLKAQLEELVNVNWLSILRTHAADRVKEEKFESTVDRKLEALSVDLGRYFSTVSNEKDQQVREFQEYFFVSLVEEASEFDIFDARRLANLAPTREALESIFQELHVPKAQEMIGQFMARATELAERSKGEKRLSSVAAKDAGLLIALRRMEALADRWRSLQKELAKIFAQREKFLAIVNSLLQRKSMAISPSNELTFTSRSGKPLTLGMLSSGEKQLIILLSETLLQQGKISIYVADEPELSLHVLWQEKLISSLKALNPKTQIIVATHSPDIVGPLSNHAIDMETVIL